MKEKEDISTLKDNCYKCGKEMIIGSIITKNSVIDNQGTGTVTCNATTEKYCGCKND